MSDSPSAAAVDLLTLEEAAELLRLTKTTARALARRDELPGAFRVGGQWRVNKARLLAHIQSQSQAS